MMVCDLKKSLVLGLLLFMSMLSAVGARDVFMAEVKDARTILLSDGREVVLKGLTLPSNVEDREKGELFLNGLIRGKSLEVIPASPGSPEVFVYYEVFPDSHTLAIANEDLPRFYVLERRPVEMGEAVHVFLNPTLVRAGYLEVGNLDGFPDMKHDFLKYYGEAHTEGAQFCSE